MSVVVNKLNVAELARELVRAFAATGGTRAAMPDGRADAVRELLTRAVVNRDVLDEHRRALAAAFRAERVAPPGDLFPLPLYDAAEVAGSGFARLGPDELAAVALDPAGYDSIDELLNREIPRGECEVEAVGPWFDEAAERWGVTPPPLPEWLEAAMSAGPPDEAPRKPSGRSWGNIVLGVALVAAVAAGAYGTLRERAPAAGAYGTLLERTPAAVDDSGERVHRDLDRYADAIALDRPEVAAANLRDTLDAAERAPGPLPESARKRLDRTRAGHELGVPHD